MTTIHLSRGDEHRVRRVSSPAETGPDAEVYAVEVDDETLARWQAAEAARDAARAAFREAMAPYHAAEEEMDRFYDEAENAYYASLPPRDPDAPPPGPIRDLFPVVGTHMMSPLVFPHVLADGDTVTFEGPTINLTES